MMEGGLFPISGTILEPHHELLLNLILIVFGAFGMFIVYKGNVKINEYEKNLDEIDKKINLDLLKPMVKHQVAKDMFGLLINPILYKVKIGQKKRKLCSIFGLKSYFYWGLLIVIGFTHLPAKHITPFYLTVLYITLLFYIIVFLYIVYNNFNLKKLIFIRNIF